MAPENTPAESDVPTRIFTQFVEKLGSVDIPTEVVARLKNTLLVDKKFTDRALQDAVFGDDNQ